MKAEVKFTKDPYTDGYANGLTMTGSATMDRFKVVYENDKEAVYKTEDGVILKAEYKAINENTKEVITSISNESDNEYTMEMITSFMVRNIKADRLHRMMSFWSMEGRHRVDDLCDINMEVSWAHHGYRVEKFGSIGSMPVRKYFPFVALEDSTTGRFTAVSLYSPSSWQIEVLCRRDETYTLTGGIADRDYGQWKKNLKPGEGFTAPKAVIAEGNSFLEVCNLLIDAQKPNISPVDNEMGITFNEYCTTWGDPTIDNLKKICDKLEGKGIQYLVMDSGWYLEKGQDWWMHIGKWEVNKDRFPNGLRELTDYVRAKGMIPGIWFEPESVAPGCELFNNKDYVLTRDGEPLSVGIKQFLDMEKPAVKAFLKEKVINCLKENDFGYIKIDYNDSIGIGCDDEEGFGEGLRKKLLASQDFFMELRRDIPKLVIENCSSGGHRLEPSMMELSSMASFSDAHETLSIPLIAANLLRLVKASQNQIWAVLRATDSDERLYYSLCATFMGRIGMSGDIYDMNEHQWALVDEGIAFYKKASNIIRDGHPTYIETDVKKYNDPEGSQTVVISKDDRMLVITHNFKNSKSSQQVHEHDRCLDIADKYSNLKIIEEFGNISLDYSAKAWIVSK